MDTTLNFLLSALAKLVNTVSYTKIFLFLIQNLYMTIKLWIKNIKIFVEDNRSSLIYM